MIGLLLLQPGALYRIRVGVAPDFLTRFRSDTRFLPSEQQERLSEALTALMEANGFSPVLFRAQDPTAETVWSFIARVRQVKPAVPPLSLLSFERVNEPPPTLRQASTHQLDRGLLAEELGAIEHALAKENEPKHLTGFASTLSPSFPIAASLLHAKAKLVETEHRGTPFRTSLREQQADTGRRYEAARAVVGLQGLPGGSIAERVAELRSGSPGESPVRTLQKATQELHPAVASAWERFVTNEPGGFVSEADAHKIATGLSVLKALGNGGGGSGLPGLGQGVAAALNLGGGLAVTEPVKQIATAFGTSLPSAIRPIFAQGLDAGASGSQGRVPDLAAMDGERAPLKTEDATIYDAGLALGYGTTLQNGGFFELFALTPGNALSEKAANFTEALALANREGSSVEDVLLQHLHKAYACRDCTEVRRQLATLIQKVVDDGSLEQLWPQALAARFRTSEAVAIAAQASVREIAPGVRFVDPERFKLIEPRDGDPPRVSATALLLAEANRSRLSNLTRPELAVQRLGHVAAMAAEGDPEAQKAAQALESADKELDRRRWVEWYRKQHELSPLR